jgi:hypothetical protein
MLSGRIRTNPTEPLSAWVKQQVAVERLRQVVSAFAAERICVLPVKGIVSASTLYPDVAERPMSDVDLRLRPEDFPRAVSLARELDWPIETHTPRLWQAEIHFPVCPVELESTIGPPGLCAIRVAEMIERSTLSTRFGFPCREPELHDHALVLCVNVFKDMLFTASWAIEDLERIVRLPAFSIDAFCALARRARLVTAISIIMHWMQETRGNAVCGAVYEAIGNPRGLRRRIYSHGYRWLCARRALAPYDALFVPSMASDTRVGVARGFSYALYGWLRAAAAKRVRA